MSILLLDMVQVGLLAVQTTDTVNMSSCSGIRITSRIMSGHRLVSQVVVPGMINHFWMTVIAYRCVDTILETTKNAADTRT